MRGFLRFDLLVGRRTSGLRTAWVQNGLKANLMILLMTAKFKQEAASFPKSENS